MVIEPEKEYIVYFYDGRVRRMFGKLSQLQKLPVSKIEEAPPAHDLFSNARRDMERINRALGEGFKMFQDVIDPQILLGRIEALHPDQAPLRLRKAIQDIFKLPRRI